MDETSVESKTFDDSNIVAQENTCYLQNTGSHTAQVRIMDESDNRVIWQGRLAPDGKTRRLSTSNGRMRYEYYYPPEESEYHSNTGANCDDGRVVKL